MSNMHIKKKFNISHNIGIDIPTSKAFKVALLLASSFF